MQFACRKSQPGQHLRPTGWSISLNNLGSRQFVPVLVKLQSSITPGKNSFNLCFQSHNADHALILRAGVLQSNQNGGIAASTARQPSRPQGDETQTGRSVAQTKGQRNECNSSTQGMKIGFVFSIARSTPHLRFVRQIASRSQVRSAKPPNPPSTPEIGFVFSRGEIHQTLPPRRLNYKEDNHRETR